MRKRTTKTGDNDTIPIRVDLDRTEWVNVCELAMRESTTIQAVIKRLCRVLQPNPPPHWSKGGSVKRDSEGEGEAR